MLLPRFLPLAIVALAVTPSTASAADVTVTNTDESGATSYGQTREARAKVAPKRKRRR